MRCGPSVTTGVWAGGQPTVADGHGVLADDLKHGLARQTAAPGAFITYMLIVFAATHGITERAHAAAPTLRFIKLA
jgi:hypothetical protein